MVKKIKILKDIILYLQTDEKNLCANTYLLKGEPNILIDAGFKVDEKIELVVLTHSHFDHTHISEQYQKQGAKISASKEASKELAKASDVVAPPLARNHFKTVPTSFETDIILQEGNIISNSNFRLKVIRCPGHTRGSIALFDEEKGILFTGDTWYGKESIGSWNHPGGNFLELQKSVKKLKALNPKLICSGHGAIKWKKQ